MHQRPRRCGTTLLAVIAVVVLLLAGCGVVDQGGTVPAQPTDAATATASAGSTQTGKDTATEHASNDVVAQSADRSDGDGSNTAAGDGADGAAERSSRAARDGDGQPPDGDEGTDRDSDQQPDRSNGTDPVDRDGTGTGTRDDSDDDTVEPGDTVTRTLRRGDTGAQVRRLQRRLKDLHYWIGPVDGVYGQLTEQAVFAFQGVEGLTIDGIVGPDTREALADATRPKARSDRGDLIEVDEQARVVLDVRDGEVRWAWHTSTGTNEYYQHPAGHTALAETPDGRHTIGWQVDGWRRNELGRLWRPKYFHSDGIALHGFSSVPATPSSHGCVRVTVPAMDFIWANDIAPEGSTVWVYGRAP